MRSKFWAHFWNYLDLIILVDGFCMIAYSFVSSFAIQSVITQDNMETLATQYRSNIVNFRHLAHLQYTWQLTLAILVFLSWIKVVVYDLSVYTVYIFHFSLSNLKLSQSCWCIIPQLFDDAGPKKTKNMYFCNA